MPRNVDQFFFVKHSGPPVSLCLIVGPPVSTSRVYYVAFLQEKTGKPNTVEFVNSGPHLPVSLEMYARLRCFFAYPKGKSRLKINHALYFDFHHFQGRKLPDTTIVGFFALTLRLCLPTIAPSFFSNLSARGPYDPYDITKNSSKRHANHGKITPLDRKWRHKNRFAMASRV